MTPLILITTEVRPDGYTWHAAADTYLKAVAAIGAVPLLLPSLGPAIDLEALLPRIDGVLLTGSRSNVHPARYGVAPSERHEPYDLHRDDTVFRLIPAALAAGVPLFAICRGFQELNVALGGTLITEAQERPGSLDHRAPVDLPQDERFSLKHDVDFEPDSRLGALLRARCVRVNSVHRQVIDRLAPGLTVEARAPDGTIEAVRVTEAPGWAFGVQWHPEYWAATDAASGALFGAFGDACRAHMGRGSAHTRAQAAE
jgi:putative glutamine amidotransferase